MEVIKKPVKKIDVQGTLLSIPAGESQYISVLMIKAASIRSAIRVLNRSGHSFEATEKGLIDKVLVTRIK